MAFYISVSPDAGGEEDRPEGAATGEERTKGAALHRQPSAMVELLGAYYIAPSTDNVEKEVDSYLKDPPPLLDSSPTEWWKTNESRFPRLAILARQYLCIPATSVPCERVFSAAGLTVTRLRSRLTPEHVDMIIFLNKNALFMSNQPMHHNEVEEI